MAAVADITTSRRYDQVIIDQLLQLHNVGFLLLHLRERIVCLTALHGWDCTLMNLNHRVTSWLFWWILLRPMTNPLIWIIWVS